MEPEGSVVLEVDNVGTLKNIYIYYHYYLVI